MVTIPFAFWSPLYQPFEGAKWIVLYVVALLSAGASIVFARYQGTLTLSMREASWFGVLLLSYSFAIFFNFQKGYAPVLLDWCAFAAVSLGALTLFASHPQWYERLRRSLYVSALASATCALLQWQGIRALEIFPDGGFPSAFFGFQNFYAEFLGFVILVLAFDRVYSRRVQGAVSWGFLALNVFVLGLQQTRSVFLALFVALTLHFILSPRGRRQVAVILGLLALSYLGGKILLYRGGGWQAPEPAAAPETFRGRPADEAGLAQLKSINASIRLARWRNTLRLIAENPAGVGPEKFPYAYLDYRNAESPDTEVSERQIAKSPHNGFLELAAENGWIVLLILIAYLSRFFRGLTGFTKSRKSLCFRILLAYFLVVAFFSFPMEVPFPFFAAAIGLGFWLRHSARELPRRSARIQLGTKSKVTLAAILLAVLLVNGGRHIFSNAVFAHRGNDPAAIALACELNPDFWQNCFRKARWEEANGQHLASLKTLSEMLKREPNLFPAIRLTAINAFRIGEHRLGCRSLENYGRLFPERSAQLREQFSDACKGHY